MHGRVPKHVVRHPPPSLGPSGILSIFETLNFNSPLCWWWEEWSNELGVGQFFIWYSMLIVGGCLPKRTHGMHCVHTHANAHVLWICLPYSKDVCCHTAMVYDVHTAYSVVLSFLWLIPGITYFCVLYQVSRGLNGVWVRENWPKYCHLSSPSSLSAVSYWLLYTTRTFYVLKSLIPLLGSGSCMHI